MSDRIRWEERHIQQILVELSKTNDAILLGDISAVTKDDVNRAVRECLPPELHKDVVSKHWKCRYIPRLQAVANSMFGTTPAPEAKPVKNPDPAPIPVFVESQPPIQPEPEAAKDTHEDETKAIRWGVSDWVKLAEEIHRQNPYYGWPYKEHLAGLTQEELKAAQANVIPMERRRKFTNMTTTKEYLIEGFKVVRKRLEEEKAEADRKLQLERELSELRVEEERKKAEVQLTLAAATAPDVEPIAVQIARAATPMVQMIAKEFASAFVQALGPMISNSLFEALTRKTEESKPEPTPEPQKKAEDPLDHQPPRSYIGPEGIPPRPPKIGVIGPPHIHQHLEEFHEIEFVFIDKAANIRDALQSCEKIIGIDKFVNEAARRVIRSSDQAKAKFVQVSGGASSIKRQINLWLSSGGLRQQHLQ